MPYCTYCGTVNIDAAQFCKWCAARIGVPIMAPAVPAALMPTVTQAAAAMARLPLKSPGLAGLLSAIWPGAGQLYSGRAVGLAQMIFIPCGYAVLLFAAFFSLAIGEFLIAALLVLATLWGWVKVIEDAAKGAQRINTARMNARATVRAARGAGYAPQPLSAPAVTWNAPARPMQAAPVIAPVIAARRVPFTPAAWESRVFVFVCALALLAVLLGTLA